MLWRKMIRDIWNNKGSYLACLVLVIIGLLIFTSFSIASDNLELSQEDFYRDQNFAHGFAELVSMPYQDLGRLSEIDGIEQVSGRVKRQVRVTRPEADIGVYLELVSIDLGDPERVSNAMLLEGTELRPGEYEIWIDNQFYDTYQLEQGYRVEIVAGGRTRALVIEGVAMSPEFTYPLRTEGELYPNPEQYGIAFISRDVMWNLFPDLYGRLNNLVFTLEQGADFDEVKNRLEPELEPYGLINLYPREDQTSHLILSEEVAQLQRMSTALPMMFLLIAALIIYNMLKRLVEQQRGQIGIMKAFGYSNYEVTLHYITYALTIGFVGGLLGGLAGIYMANPLTWLLLEFFHVPETYEGFSLYYFGLGIGISLAIFLVAGYQGCKYALKLKPAEAMRPPAPVSGKKTLLEKISLFTEMLTIQGKMAIRNLTRNRSRTAFLFLGMTLSCAVVIVTWSLNDVIDKLVFYQYEEVEVHDARVVLTDPAHEELAIRELAKHDEITLAEPLAEVPVKLSNAWRDENIMVLGLPENSSLYMIRDKGGRRVHLPENGLILSERLADKLHVSAGSTLELESPYLRNNNDPALVEVYQVIPQYMGMNAYMDLGALQDLLGQGSFVTSLMLDIDADGLDRGELVQKNIGSLRDRYLESDLVAAVDGIEDRIREARELMETFGIAIYIYVLFGVIIAFAIIYSSSFIILSERNRELASMKVLGMTSREVFSVITFEQWFICIFAILAGLPLAQLMIISFANELSTDMYTIPADLSQDAFLMGALITAASIWIAQRFALRKVRKLDLVEVLKTRE